MQPDRVIQYRPIRAQKVQSLQDFFAVRGKDGMYKKNLRCAFHRLRQETTRINLRIFGVHLMRFLLGDRLMNAALSDRAVVTTGMYCGSGKTEGKWLYHIAPSDCVGSILSSGLLPKDRFVYLTDDPEHYALKYLSWKTEQIRASTAYTLLQVDAQQLTATQEVFCTDREHEYVTGIIDAKYVSVAHQKMSLGD